MGRILVGYRMVTPDLVQVELEDPPGGRWLQVGGWVGWVPYSY